MEAARYADGQRYAEKAMYAETKSDAQGRFSISASQPALSYTYSITFEATD